ncbi:SDR family NAD(P)-dependent oxidoreductase [Acidaminobacter sp. JC074]|uniref:SDR family NAD(P)-dependent oxidoreductase n=1 Tax=Acidaminobacter sp. JC074 TaxID=2530199 RepID=UPI001F0E1990|nr:SDR family NAD(P)-dependent oxidoreductase [Acidaminobacter sp. JC074]MCH4889218.1 SDR family NAD(P)-dependent oxidoreductase [Acidaminobacter sp. JC074]
MKTALITGSTDGLGKGVAIELARKNYRVLLHGRDPEKGMALVNDIKILTGNKNMCYYNADFSDLNAVKELAREIIENEASLDVLVNNAGLGIEDSKRLSHQGHEMLFQVNYLATYMMTRMLTGLLSNSYDGRIVNIASAGQEPLDFSDVMLDKAWSGYQAYCQSKLSQIAMTFELADELFVKGISINALHPASMMPTKIVSHSIDTLEMGIKSVVKLVDDEDLKSVTGKYFFKTVQAESHEWAYDKKSRVKLINLSYDLTGL